MTVGTLSKYWLSSGSSQAKSHLSPSTWTNRRAVEWNQARSATIDRNYSAASRYKTYSRY